MGTEKRRKPRQRCSIEVEVRTWNCDCKARVVDISENGMCIAVDRTVNIWPDQDIQIRCNELGHLPGRTRWRNSGRIGIEFNASTDTRAKIDAYRKYFLQSAMA